MSFEYVMYFELKSLKIVVFGRTCSMLSDLLISPDDKVTMAFIPSGVMSMLAQRERQEGTMFIMFQWLIPIFPTLLRMKHTSPAGSRAPGGGSSGPGTAGRSETWCSETAAPGWSWTGSYRSYRNECFLWTSRSLRQREWDKGRNVNNI